MATNNIEWIKQELNDIGDNKPIEKTEGLKLEENKVTEFEIDVSKPFEKWTDPETHAVKKIIPVIHNGIKKHFWLNVANPLYRTLLEEINNGNLKVKVMRTGSAKATRYILVK